MNQPKLLGEILFELELVTESDITKGLLIQKQIGGRIGSILVRTGVLSENKLIEALRQQLGIDRLNFEEPIPNSSQFSEFIEDFNTSIEWQLDQKVLVWKSEKNDSLVYCAKDLSSDLLHDALKILFNKTKLTPVLATNQQLSKLLHQLESLNREKDDDIHDPNFLKEMAEDAPIVELVSNFMSQAMERAASDIHIEPGAEHFNIRFRIDGILHNIYEFPIVQFNAVASRVKLISGIDIAERRLPQDGRLSIRLSGMETDIRVSSLPGVFGESIVMRLLPKERKDLKLERLGMAPDHLKMMKLWMKEPNGIILVTGPTGSGKSTTLYGALDETNDGIRKIITVEDPVEFQLSGITQIQAHADIGLTFASALRSILRQDPDIIMVGEIRDLETAEIAIQSALTGHLVLSTLHTNSALDAFTRLIDMGVEPFLVAAPIRAVQAQRLVRRLCKSCSKESSKPSQHLWSTTLNETFLSLYPDTKMNWKEAVGCDKCHQTGYQGRLGIYELISVSEDLRHLISNNSAQHLLIQQAEKDGFRNLRDDGLIKAARGLTSIDEIVRVSMNQRA